VAGLNAILANLRLCYEMLRENRRHETVEVHHRLIADDADNLSTIELPTIALVNRIANLMHSTFLSFSGTHFPTVRDILSRTLAEVKSFFRLPSPTIRTIELALAHIFLDIARMAASVIPHSHIKCIQHLLAILANLLFRLLHYVLLFLHHVEHITTGHRGSQQKKKPHP